MIECFDCGREASHILVGYRHEIKGATYCTQHAFTDNREKCSCCSDYFISVYDEDKGYEVDLLPTYSEGELDSTGCCSEHP